MYIFWFILAGVMILGYVYGEWQITQGLIRRIYRKEHFSLPGKKRPFVIFRFLLGFFAVSFLYFGLTNFTGSDIRPGCWLLPAFLSGGVVAINTHVRVKHLEFGGEPKGQAETFNDDAA